MDKNSFPLTTPHVNTNLDVEFQDHSMIDDSIKQEGVSI